MTVDNLIPLPDWLTQPATPAPDSATATLPLPDWLAAPTQLVPVPAAPAATRTQLPQPNSNTEGFEIGYRTLQEFHDDTDQHDGKYNLGRVGRYSRTKEGRELQLVIFDIIFLRLCEQVMGGRSPRSIITNDPRNLNFGAFMRWVRKDPARQEALDEAQKVGAEVLAMEIVEIADGTYHEQGHPTDTQRDKLRVDARRWTAEKWNTDKYGATKNVNMRVSSDPDAAANLMTTADLRAELAKRFKTPPENVIDVTPEVDNGAA